MKEPVSAVKVCCLMILLERQKIIHIYFETSLILDVLHQCKCRCERSSAAADAEDSADSQFFIFVQLIESSQTKQTV